MNKSPYTRIHASVKADWKKAVRFASFLGFIPIFFIWNTIGSGLNKYIKQADNFSFINLVTFLLSNCNSILFVIIIELYQLTYLVHQTNFHVLNHIHYQL